MFAAVRVYWGAGFRFGLRTFLAYEGEREAEIIANSRFIALGLWGVAALSLCGAAVAGAVLRGWDGALLPRQLLTGAAASAAGILLLRGIYGLLSSSLRLAGQSETPASVDAAWFWLDLVLLSPAFTTVGISFAVLA